MINNLEKIKPFLTFDNDGDFYFVQVIRRKREHPDKPKSERLINSYFIRSLEDLDKKFDDMKSDAEIHKARVYIWINKRNDEKIALETLRLIADNIANKTYRIQKCFLSICGKFNSQKDKRWIIDLDNDLGISVDEVLEYINILPPFGEKLKVELETPNGKHLIVSPFDLQKFRAKFKIDVQKDNPTILYFSGEKDLT